MLTLKNYGLCALRWFKTRHVSSKNLGYLNSKQRKTIKAFYPLYLRRYNAIKMQNGKSFKSTVKRGGEMTEKTVYLRKHDSSAFSSKALVSVTDLKLWKYWRCILIEKHYCVSAFSGSQVYRLGTNIPPARIGEFIIYTLHCYQDSNIRRSI